MTHSCHFPACRARVSKVGEYCSKHWQMLPQRVRNMLATTPGQVTAWIHTHLSGEVKRLETVNGQ